MECVCGFNPPRNANPDCERCQLILDNDILRNSIRNLEKELKMDLNLDEIFTYHKPFGNQPNRYEEIRSQGKMLARIITAACPESAERTLAIRKVQEAVMWANVSIAINEKEDESPKDNG
jgi:hypothetical protein